MEGAEVTDCRSNPELSSSFTAAIFWRRSWRKITFSSSSISFIVAYAFQVGFVFWTAELTHDIFIPTTAFENYVRE